jgi:hypothetical protein
MASNPQKDHACIYCGDSNSLEDEHVMPFGLGGRQILKRASCRRCATETGRLEQRLLRGQWWPYRKALGIATRSKEYPRYQPAQLVPLAGEKRPVQVLSDEVPVVLFFDFDPPSVLAGQVRSEPAFARHASVKFIKEGPRRVLEEGVMRNLLPWEKVEYPMNFDSHDVLRFIAKVAHCFAVLQRGPGACTEFFLPSIILGKTEGALSYVGSCSTEVLKPRLPGQELHAMLDREVDGLLVVNVQVFRDAGDPPPIYEAVVGRVPQ